MDPSGLFFFDDFDYVVARDQANKTTPFTAAGWAGVKSEPTDNAAGYLYTVDAIPGYGGAFPGSSSRALAIEARPGTFGQQTDFYLQHGAIPADVWFQFWVYPQDSGSQQSLYGNRNKFIYPTQDSYPSHSLRWMIGQGSYAYNPHNEFPVGATSDGVFIWNNSSAAGVSTIAYTGSGADPDSADQLGCNLVSASGGILAKNAWTLVKIHLDTSNPASGIYEMWLRPMGGGWTKVAEWIGGVTPNFVWTMPNGGGHVAFRMPTTVGGPTSQWWDYWMYLQDFAIAESEGDLPTY